MVVRRLLRKSLLPTCLLLAAFTTVGRAAYNNSIFNANNYYPTVWWSVSTTDVPSIANNALILRQNTVEPNLFAQNVVLGIANNQRDAVSKAIGYMINANSTVGGGCPVPPPPTQDLTRFGDAIATAVLNADNVTALWGGLTLAQVAKMSKSKNVTKDSLKAVNGFIVADTILGGLFIAGKSCGPPDALTSSFQSSVIAKYLNATCFYVGPIVREITLNNTRKVAAWNTTFAYDIALSNTTDPYVTSPVLTAYKQCIDGPLSLEAIPTWLYYSFGPVVSIDGGSDVTGSTVDSSSSAGPAASPAGVVTEGGEQTGALRVTPSTGRRL